MRSSYLRLGWGTFMLVFAGVLLFASLVMITGVTAGQQPAGAPAIDADDIGGVVTGAQGPEAGVWVIAETRNLPTRLIKSVVTDDRGRFLVPDLPTADYDVWVRGYGLVDSPKVKASPGRVVNLKAVAAPDKKAAAQYYPAQYWYSLMQLPPKSDFPGTGESGNGISPNIDARASGSATSSTPTAAPAAIRWATRPRGRFRRASSTSFRIRRWRGTAAFRPDRPAAA